MPSQLNWFGWTKLLFSFLFSKDINECDPSGLSSEYQHLDHICHDDANCTNTKGSYYCGCLNGYSGLGEYCTGTVLGILSLNSECVKKRINNGKNGIASLPQKRKGQPKLNLLSSSMNATFEVFFFHRYWRVCIWNTQLSCWRQLHQHQRIILLHVSYGILRRWSHVYW